MQLYIIRHAQSENNALWAKTGSSVGRVPDPALTEVGHRQAERLAAHLTVEDGKEAHNGYDPHNRRGFHLTHLYTSLMIRAVDTGRYVAQAADLPLVAWEEIHEWGGIFDHDHETDEKTGLPGPNRAYFATHYPELQLPPELGEDGWWNRPFEKSEQRVPRTQKFLSDLLARHGDTDDRVAIVTHGGFTFTLLQVLVGFPHLNEALEMPRRVWFLKNNTAISRLNFSEENVDIVYMNHVNHLPTDLVT